MLPSELLLSAKNEITFYILDAYIDNLKADGDYKLAGTEESMLQSTLRFYASQGNPKVVVPVVVPETEDPTHEIDFPDEFSSVIQVRDENLQSVPFTIDSVNSKISFSAGYQTPYSLRYRYKLEDYFAYSVDGNGSVTVDTDKDITDVQIVTLVKRLLKEKLKEYNNKISEMSKSMQMDLPSTEGQGEKALAEEAIKMNTRVMPSLMSI